MCVCVKQLFPAPADISLDFLWYSSDRLCESSTSDWSASSFTLVHGTLPSDQNLLHKHLKKNTMLRAPKDASPLYWTALVGPTRAQEFLLYREIKILEQSYKWNGRTLGLHKGSKGRSSQSSIHGEAVYLPGWETQKINSNTKQVSQMQLSWKHMQRFDWPGMIYATIFRNPRSTNLHPSTCSCAL